MAALRARGVLHARADVVSDPAFVAGGFFDARDLIQVKYEMVRRVEREGWGVGQAAAAFALSRQTFYQAREALARAGLPGLLPQPPGPRQGHKLSEAVLDFLEAVAAAAGDPSAAELAGQVRERFGIRVHPRSIERGLARRRAEKGGGEAG